MTVSRAIQQAAIAILGRMLGHPNINCPGKGKRYLYARGALLLVLQWQNGVPGDSGKIRCTSSVRLEPQFPSKLVAW